MVFVDQVVDDVIFTKDKQKTYNLFELICGVAGLSNTNNLEHEDTDEYVVNPSFDILKFMSQYLSMFSIWSKSKKLNWLNGELTKEENEKPINYTGMLYTIKADKLNKTFVYSLLKCMTLVLGNISVILKVNHDEYYIDQLTMDHLSDLIYGHEKIINYPNIAPNEYFFIGKMNGERTYYDKRLVIINGLIVLFNEDSIQGVYAEMFDQLISPLCKRIFGQKNYTEKKILKNEMSNSSFLLICFNYSNYNPNEKLRTNKDFFNKIGICEKKIYDECQNGNIRLIGHVLDVGIELCLRRISLKEQTLDYLTSSIRSKLIGRRKPEEVDGILEQYGYQKFRTDQFELNYALMFSECNEYMRLDIKEEMQKYQDSITQLRKDLENFLTIRHDYY